MVARRLTALAIGAACASCALILGYGDPVEVAPPDDGGSSGSPDARADVGVDAGRDSNAPFCASLSPAPTFCASFDEASYLSGWGSTDLVSGTVTRDTSTFTSSPASMRAAFTPGGSGNTVNAAVGIDFVAFDSRPFTAKIGFDVRIEAASPSGAFAVIGNALVVGHAAPYLLQIVATPLPDGSSAALSLVEVIPGASTVEHRATQNLTYDRWSHLDVTITIASLAAAAGNAVSFVVDGKSAFAGALVTPIGAGIPGSSFGLAAVAKGTTAWALRFDDVTIDIH